MIQKISQSVQWALPVLAGACLLALFVWVQPASAQLNPIPTPDPKPGSFGIEATKIQDPPKQGATITIPANGATFTTSPQRVSGICPGDLLVQIFNNGVMVGAVICEGGSFSLDVSLFSGINELSAKVYDPLDQTGPDSNVVSVTYTDTQFEAFGTLITLTSAYGRRSAPVGSQLVWPLQLSGGVGPYAFSIDWGDGSGAELKSQSLAGLVNISRVYEKAGLYQVSVKVTDTNGVSAFLQVIAVGSGKVEPAEEVEEVQSGRTVILWVPAAVALALLVPTYWLGRRSQVVSLRNKMLKERDSYKEF